MNLRCGLLLLVLATGVAVAGESTNTRVLEQVRARHGGELLWVQGGRPTARARALVAVLSDAERFGLRSEDYDVAQLMRQLQRQGGAQAAEVSVQRAFDAQLTLSLLALLHDLHFGRIDPRAAGFDMPPRRDAFDAAALLEQLATTAEPEAVFAGAEPAYEHYRLLLQALAQYRRLAATVPTPRLPRLTGSSVRVGQSYSGAPALRRMLSAIGVLSPDLENDPSPVIDTELSAALRRYQYLNGLREDGNLGRETLAALQVPLASRVRQIELTLERWRWLPVLQPRTLIVNIPAFRLFLIRSPVDREADMLRMNVIVGREYPERRTPIFASDMDAIIFRPYWDVPSSITERELLPQLRRNPSLMDEQHLELVTNDARALPVPPAPQSFEALARGQLRLRQRPGTDNALGLIKFVLPNRYDVYLHSTPAQRLFSEPRRDFSHGCVRVSDPVALAVAVLEGTPGDWTPDKVRAAMDGESTFRVALAHPVHVLIVYGTSVASEDGAVHFFHDIYGFDARLDRLLRVSSAARAKAPSQ